MAASPSANAGTNGASGSLGTNGIYDLNAAQLRPLPLVAEEAEAVRTLNAALVTLSAYDTSTGAAHGQDGVASLVRPFVAAGARAVVTNLWAADDTFSAAMMREFYRELASGGDIGESLRQAKLRMIETFGPEAVPRLWSGVLVHGDAAAVVIPAGSTARTGGSK